MGASLFVSCGKKYNISEVKRHSWMKLTGEVISPNELEAFGTVPTTEVEEIKPGVLQHQKIGEETVKTTTSQFELIV